MPNAKGSQREAGHRGRADREAQDRQQRRACGLQGNHCAQDTALRAECRKNELDYAVVKNTLVRFAINNVVWRRWIPS